MNMKKLFSCLAFVTVLNSTAWANPYGIVIPGTEHFYAYCDYQVTSSIPFELRKKIHWDLCYQKAKAQSIATRYNIPLNQALALVPL